VSEYAVELRKGRVTLPTTGGDGNLASVSSWDEAEDNLEAFAAPFYPRRCSAKIVKTTAVLVHRADNDYNPNAISVSTPAAGGGSMDERHLGYLFNHFLRRVGTTNLPDLIGFAGGEVECTVVLEGRDNLSVDLPDPVVLGDAIRTFLADHGVQAAGAPRPKDAPRELHSHTANNPLTARTLRLLGTYSEDASTVMGLHMAAARYGGVAGRTLQLSDKTSGRALGALDGRWLQLNDERNRDTLLGLLDREGIPVNRPVTNPKVREDGTWPPGVPPNVRFRRGAGGLDLRVHDPENPNSEESFAVYNPTLDVLWVEDSRLVAPALRFMHRQGLDVAEVGLPRRSWGLDTETTYSSLRDPERPWRNDGHDWAKVPLLRSVRPLVPSGVLTTDTVAWVSDDVPRPDPEPSFALLERYVRERSTLFPVHSLTSQEEPCRLCGGHATLFTTPIATEALAYCHTCLANAIVGLVEDRTRAGVALKELSRLEFDGQPMLASQLESLHINPKEPVDATSIDRLLLLRFGVARKRVAWTLLLEAAGFAEGGLRTGRGTLIRSRDGHLCLSLRERAVCDFLHQHSIQHDREPLCPHDPDYNPNGLRRADWILADGTLVELWGLANDPQYAAKMVEKRLLAERHGLRLVELVDKDLPKLIDIFEPWLQPGTKSSWSWSPLLVTSSSTIETAKEEPARGDDRGRNDFNAQAQRERVARCAVAVRLQQRGLSRTDIGRRLGAGADAMKILLRDGKFYANPASDAARAALARQARAARDRRLTRAQFQAQAGVTTPKAQEAWRDAAVLHEADCAESSTGSRRQDGSVIAASTGPTAAPPQDGQAADQEPGTCVDE
jgi:hypothetical protein